MSKFLIMMLVITVSGTLVARDYTFGDYATRAGLTGAEVRIQANNKGITDLDGLANNYDYLQNLYLRGNKLTS